MTFSMYSPLHYAMMISPLFLITILYYFTKDTSDEKKRKIGIFLSSFLILLLLLRNIEIFVVYDYVFDFELVPLQVCHFANFVLLYAFYKRSNTAFALAFTLNLLPAYLSVVFANGLENYVTILNFRGFAYIVGHIGITVVTIWAYLVKFINISFKTYLNTLKVMIVLFFSSVIVNNLFRILLDQPSNYFYTEHPELGTPLEWFYHMGQTITIFSFEFNPIYMVLLMVFGIVLTFFLYVSAFVLPNIYHNRNFSLKEANE